MLKPPFSLARKKFNWLPPCHPLVIKSRNSCSPPRPIVGKIWNTLTPHQGPPLVSDIICERPLTLVMSLPNLTVLTLIKDCYHQLNTYISFLMSINDSENSSRLLDTQQSDLHYRLIQARITISWKNSLVFFLLLGMNRIITRHGYSCAKLTKENKALK